MIRFHRHAGLVVCSLAAGSFLGCQEDEIRRYQVARVETARADRPKVRMLGAVVPRGERTWFFKLMGPAQAVEEHKEAFDRFIRSVRFTDRPEQPITWDAPETWKREPGGGLRYATFRLGAKDASLELTVIALGREAASVLDNINRWRGQIGLKPVAEADLGQLTEEVKLEGATATLVDMTGQATGKPGMGQ